MLKISIVEGRRQRRVIVEGKLIAPWIAELHRACDQARVNLQDRDLVLDLSNLTVISQAGENALLVLMKQGIKFRCGVFTKHVVSQLARRVRRKASELRLTEEE